ncbi:MAG TPA: hypothetical protein ENI23_02300 [bacterium]|nr:hypothetical protein [bacterium]
MVAFATIAIIPAFQLNVLGINISWPELDYSSIVGSEKSLNLSFRRGKGFENSTVLKLFVQSGSNETEEEVLADVREIGSIIKQRLEIMEVKEGEVYYYKENDIYFIQVKIPGSNETVINNIIAIESAGNIEIWEASAPQVAIGEEIVSDPPDSPSENPALAGYQPTGLLSDSFVTADLTVNPLNSSYVIKVGIDESRQYLIQQILGQGSAVAVVDDFPVAAVTQDLSPNKIGLEFLPLIGDGEREDTLTVLALFGTKTYPRNIRVISQEIFAPEYEEESLLLVGVLGILVFMSISLFLYRTFRKGFLPLTGLLYTFSVFTLILFKLPVFRAEITATLLVGFVFSFLFAGIIFYLLIAKILGRSNQDSEKRRLKILNQEFDTFRKSFRFLLFGILFWLIILESFHGNLYSQFIFGFGYGITVLLGMLYLFLKPLLRGLYVSPINLNGIIKKA